MKRIESVKSYFPGEVHPNERGYRLMAYKALETFTRL